MPKIWPGATLRYGVVVPALVTETLTVPVLSTRVRVSVIGAPAVGRPVAVGVGVVVIVTVGVGAGGSDSVGMTTTVGVGVGDADFEAAPEVPAPDALAEAGGGGGVVAGWNGLRPIAPA